MHVHKLMYYCYWERGCELKENNIRYLCEKGEDMMMTRRGFHCKS